MISSTFLSRAKAPTFSQTPPDICTHANKKPNANTYQPLITPTAFCSKFRPAALVELPVALATATVVLEVSAAGSVVDVDTTMDADEAIFVVDFSGAEVFVVEGVRELAKISVVGASELIEGTDVTAAVIVLVLTLAFTQVV